MTYHYLSGAPSGVVGWIRELTDRELSRTGLLSLKKNDLAIVRIVVAAITTKTRTTTAIVVLGCR